MTRPPNVGTLTIGSAGELLVQYKLLKLGIDSARLTTDSGIDLAMYVPGTREAITVQVKATWGTSVDKASGRPWLVFPAFPADWKAQYLATVDLSRDAAWLFPIPRAEQVGRLNKAGTEFLLWWYMDGRRGSVIGIDEDYEQDRLEVVAAGLLPSEPEPLP